MRSFLWAGLSFASSRLLVFVTTLLLARMLTPRDFGVVAAGLAVVALLEIALDLGVGAAVVYEQEEGLSERVRTACTLNLVLSCVLALLGASVAPVVAALFQAPESVDVLRALCVYLVLRGAGQVHFAVLQRDLRFRSRAAVEIARAAVRACVSVSVALTGAGPWAIVFGLLAGELAALVVLLRCVSLWPSIRPRREVVSTLLRFGLAVFALKLSSALTTNSDKIAVGSVLGPASLGLYVMAFRLPELTIDAVGWVFSSVAFAFYAQARADGVVAFRQRMLTALRLTTMFGFPAGVGLAVAAPVAVPLLFSARWEPAVGATVLLALATGISSIGYASGDIFPALGRPGTLLRLNLSTVPVAIAGFWLAAPAGITAVAVVWLLFQLLYNGLRLHLANRLLGTAWREEFAAMRPGVVAALGTLPVALPASLLVPAGGLALVVTVTSGVVGAVSALLLFARSDVKALVTLLGRGLRRGLP